MYSAHEAHNLIGQAQLLAPQPIRRAFCFTQGLLTASTARRIGPEPVEGLKLCGMFIYILLCLDGSLYTGSSNNPDARFEDHKNGKGGRYTRSHKPIKLLYTKQLESKSLALKRESEIKSWSREKKIRVLKLGI